MKLSAVTLRKLACVFGCAVVMAGCGGGSKSAPAGVSQPISPAASAPASFPPPTLLPVPAPVYPLHVEAGKRYLVDAAGKPFFVNGDSPWELMVQLTREQVDQYLEDRRLKGVNTVLVELIEHYFASNAPKNVYGDAPFTTAGDFGTPNEAYFAQADYVIRKAAEKGMVVLLAPAYVGYNGASEGWYQEMAANGTSKLYAYGQYVGNRYKSFDNIVWVDGGDYNVANKALVQAVANGIRSVDGKPHTYHGARGTAAMQFWGTGEPWLTVNNIYTDETTVVAAAFGEYARSTAPFFLTEARYEGSNNATEQTVRMQAYQTVLSGGSGHVMGNEALWQLKPGWSQLLNSGGARSLLPLSNLFTTRSWWTLQPDTGNTLLSGGVSTGADRAVAARAADGSYAIAYMPSIRSVSIDLSKLAGPKVKAQWVDPASGATSTVSGSPFTAFGTQLFRPSGNNAAGYADWVMLLESTP
jgi:Protein of unknown function (DUF4038)/Putative collagen-binding domain of a collagenase